MKTAFAALAALVALSGCQAYGTKTKDDPNAGVATVRVDDLAMLKLRGSALEIVAIDDEVARDPSEARLHSGKRTVVVSAVLTTGAVRDRYQRVPVLRCGAKLEFTAKPGGSYTLVAEDLWRHDPKVQIVDEAQGSTVATKPCTGRDL